MKALILVDIQNDFLPGGALGVEGGFDVIPVANRLAREHSLVVATQDWHPPGHESFAIWPEHCVQGSRGAELATSLDRDSVHHVVQKGTDPAIDSYSGFFDNERRKATGLGEFLAARGVTEVDIVGLATDYCVKFTALDARRLGLAATVIRSGCRAVNLEPGDEEKAYAEMRAAGVTIAD